MIEHQIDGVLAAQGPVLDELDSLAWPHSSDGVTTRRHALAVNRIFEGFPQ